MSGPINITAARAGLAQLVDRAAAGEEIVIAKAGCPRARLLPLVVATSLREPGGWRASVRIGDEFDTPLQPQDLL
ncbi:MAG: type II toxin-antitoxin system Phd/YefM family antitoxin [Longimicrobiales bacterium]